MHSCFMIGLMKSKYRLCLSNAGHVMQTVKLRIYRMFIWALSINDCMMSLTEAFYGFNFCENYVTGQVVDLQWL